MLKQTNKVSATINGNNIHGISKNKMPHFVCLKQNENAKPYQNN